MTEITVKCGKYQHFRNKKFYEVLGTARHSETEEELVIYVALYDCEKYGRNKLWARPKQMFLEEIMHEGSKVPRFQWVGD